MLFPSDNKNNKLLNTNETHQKQHEKIRIQNVS